VSVRTKIKNSPRFKCTAIFQQVLGMQSIYLSIYLSITALSGLELQWYCTCSKQERNVSM